MPGPKWRLKTLIRSRNDQASSVIDHLHQQSQAKTGACSGSSVSTAGTVVNHYPKQSCEGSTTSGRTSVETCSSSCGEAISGDRTHPRSPVNSGANREKASQGTQSRWRPLVWDRKCNLSSLAATSTSTTSSIGSESGSKRKAVNHTVGSTESQARVTVASATSTAATRGSGSSSKSGESPLSTFGDGMMSSMPPGARRVDGYDILDTLGEGYSGKVKRGRDVRTQKMVALKVMFKQTNDQLGNKRLERLRTEVDAMRRCNGHMHIVKLFEPMFNSSYPKRDGKGQPAHILVMELCERGELFELLYRGGPVPPNISQEYFRQLMKGISFCHSKGVAHRDLKPENLLLDEKFTLKIADFGFAAVEKPSMICQSIVGSRTYMAPEVLSMRIRDYDGFLADVWSAGVILFTMLAGHPPMEKADESDWWFRALKLRRLDLFWQSHKRTLPTTFSREAEHLISAMLTVNPSERIRVEEILKHPYLAPPPTFRSFTFRAPTDPGHDLRAEMQHRYQLAMASKRLCTLTSSSRGTTDTSTGNSSSRSPSRGSGRGAAAADTQATAAGRTQGRHDPFNESVYRGLKDGEEVDLPVIGIEEAMRVTGGFMANGQPGVIMNALHRELFDMEAHIDGVQRDGTRMLRTSNKVSAMIPATPESGGGEVRIVVTIFRISRQGLDKAMEREVGEVPDLLVVIRRKGGDYYRYLKVEDSLITRMTPEK